MASRGFRAGFSLSQYLASAPSRSVPADEYLRHAARLANIKVDPAEYRADLESMVRFASLLHQVDTSGVEPLEALVDLWQTQQEPLAPLDEPPPGMGSYYHLPVVLENKGQ